MPIFLTAHPILINRDFFQKLAEMPPSDRASKPQELARAEAARAAAEASLQRASEQIQELQRQTDEMKHHKTFKQDQYIDQLHSQISTLQKVIF